MPVAQRGERDPVERWRDGLEAAKEGICALPSLLVQRIGGAPILPATVIGGAGLAGSEKHEPLRGLLQSFVAGRGTITRVGPGSDRPHPCRIRRQWVTACSMYFLTMLTETPSCRAISA